MDKVRKKMTRKPQSFVIVLDVEPNTYATRHTLSFVRNR